MAHESTHWVELCVIASDIDARLIQGRLETEGIPCTIESLKFYAEPVNLGALSEVRLHVLDKHLERARELLEQAEQQDLL